MFFTLVVLLLLSFNSHQLGNKIDSSKRDVIFYNAQYSIMEHYLNDVVVKELKVMPLMITNSKLLGRMEIKIGNGQYKGVILKLS